MLSPFANLLLPAPTPTTKSYAENAHCPMSTRTPQKDFLKHTSPLHFTFSWIGSSFDFTFSLLDPRKTKTFPLRLSSFHLGKLALLIYRPKKFVNPFSLIPRHVKLQMIEQVLSC